MRSRESNFHFFFEKEMGRSNERIRTREFCAGRTQDVRLSGRNFRQDRKRNPRTKDPTHDVSCNDYYVRSARRAARSFACRVRVRVRVRS